MRAAISNALSLILLFSCQTAKEDQPTLFLKVAEEASVVTFRNYLHFD